ncbi:hypothetical protein [Arsukibacterium sp. UBA3155]|uniref:hypothetical protein n=1 Tax=Arsukibacterium sp. UBA3155 TaxID=1946058 RepID=UPI0025C2A860|nr:hypothetical protein [Arsukibacterium sp. UBA3155]|tara:strand:+ start:29488 stop:29871 length:384 start_codon:yes stop_codon:yes gene_type:complete
MTKLDKDQVIADFTAAYKAEFGKAPELEQKPGWFSVDGGKNIRLAELAELADSYGKGGKTKAAATKADKPAKADKKPAKPAAKAAAKPAAKGKAKAAKPANTTPGAAAAFWADKINDSKQRPPRGAR